MTDGQSRAAANPASERERVSLRHKIFEPVSVIVGNVETRAHLLNISATGALVHCETAPDAGSAIHVEMNGSVYPAHIVWRDGARFGVTFGSDLSQPVLQAILR